MSQYLSILHAAIRFSHIGLGFVGLALFWLIIALPKGSRTHVLCGKIFAAVTWCVGGSALFSSLWALVHVDSFAAIPQDSAEGDRLREILHFLFAILLYLSAATISGAVFGVQVMRTRGRHDDLRRTSLPIWLSVTAMSALGLITFGICHLTGLQTLRGSMPLVAYWIPVLVGSFGLQSVWQEWRYVFGTPPGPREWLYRHVRQMCGTGIAFHTAFLVFGANRMFGFRLPGAWALLPWILPPVLGMSLTARYIRQLKRTDSRNDLAMEQVSQVDLASSHPPRSPGVAQEPLNSRHASTAAWVGRLVTLTLSS